MLPVVTNQGPMVQTLLAGGTEGNEFNDLDKVSKWPSQNIINTVAPILKIEIAHGWVVDSLDITYNLTGGIAPQTVRHGSPIPPRSTVTIGESEVIVGVSGKAGLHPYYKRSLLNQISFIILNSTTGAIRTAGPFGNGDQGGYGTTFHASGPVAFAGYETNESQIGMSGLSIIRSINWE